MNRDEALDAVRGLIRMAGDMEDGVVDDGDGHVVTMASGKLDGPIRAAAAAVDVLATETTAADLQGVWDGDPGLGVCVVAGNGADRSRGVVGRIWGTTDAGEGFTVRITDPAVFARLAAVLGRNAKDPRADAAVACAALLGIAETVDRVSRGDGALGTADVAAITAFLQTARAALCAIAGEGG